MDAPPTQYRVIERGRKLIVLETQTNLPPKQACDMQPGPQETASALPVMEALAPTHSDRPRLQDEGNTPADGFEGFFDGRMNSKGEGPSAGSIGIGAVIFGIAVGVMIGGFTGFLFTAAIIIIAGNVAFRRAKKPS